MAKIKISELEREYGASRTEIIAFLKEKGYDVKTANSSVEDDGAAAVAARFGAKKENAQPASAKSANTAASQKAVDVKEKGADVPNTASAHKNASAEKNAERAESAAKTAPKKKKIIIVTSNSSGGRQGSGYSSGYNKGSFRSGRSGSGQGSGSGQYGSYRGRQPQGGRGASGAYHPIKPTVVPSQMETDFHKSPAQPAHKIVRPRTQPSDLTKAEENTIAAPVQNSVQEVEKTIREEKSKPQETVENTVQETVQKSVEKPVSAAAKSVVPSTADNTSSAKIPEHAPEANRVQSPARRIERNEHPGRTERPVRNDSAEKNSASERRSGYSQGGRSENRSGDRPRYNNQNNQGGSRPRNGSGSFGDDRKSGQGQRNGFARPGQGRFQSGSEDRGRGFRSGAAAGGTQNRRGAHTGPGVGADNGSSFAQNGKRRMNQAKDKRNKKDVAFAEEEQRERKNRSGRFIKPVVEQQKEPEEQIKVITIPEKLTIGNLADAMHMKASDVIKKLFLSGKAMTINSEITYEEAEDIASDYDILCEKEEKVDQIEELLKEDVEDEKDMVPRPPVCCVMGHVDHGKTSILDYIRKTKVTDREAGGITQAIGAYTVNVKGRTITFLDTPGHEAFTAMRLRGAQSTDIAVLVVAADDGVMPQTIEAIHHAKAAGVEIIVAVNKIDKPNANPDRVREQLSKYELIPSDWGGQTEFVNVSAKTGEGISDLLDTILLTADVMELKANPNRLARGLVLEAKLDKGRGPVANALVQKGTLHVGDFISAGAASGKVRALINDDGENVKEAGPSMPVMVLGLSEVPSAGEVILAHATNDEAKQFANTYKAQHKEELVEENRMSMNVEDLFDQMREGKMKELELIVKADVQGSVEALCSSLQKLSNDEVMVKIIHSAVGAITESDVNLAAASNAAIIGFNVHPDATAKSIAEHNGVSIHLYKVIYQAIDDVDAALKGMLAPVYEEKVIGHAEVRQIFKSGKIGNIAGCMVLDGVVERDCSVRITRDKDKIFEGNLASLKRFKDDVKEVKAGFDCGLVFKDFDSMNIGDQIEAYKMVEVPREQVIAMKEKEKREAEKAAKKQPQ